MRMRRWPSPAGAVPRTLRTGPFPLLLLLACLALPATAGAAAPFTAGSGTEPTVAVGTDGSGHVAWETNGESVGVGYCRVSPGGSGCNHTVSLPFPGSEAFSAGRAQVFAPATNRVVIVAGCWNCPSGTQDRVYAWISNDNGQSFSLPTQLGEDLGNGNSFGGLGIWLDGSYTYVGTDGPNVKAQQGPIYTEGTGVEFATGGLFAYTPSVVRVPGSNKLVAAANDLETIKYAVYNGAPLSVSNVNTAANWATDLVLPGAEGDNSDTMLNSGPAGVTLTYLSYRPNDSRVGLRRFDSATNGFGAPVYLEGGDAIEDQIDFGEPASAQDPAGRIHVVWSSQYANDRLRYTVSAPAGGSFSTPATLAANEEFHQPEVAAGSDGHGFAVWSHYFSGAVRVVPLDPYPESAAVAPPPPPPPSRPQVGGFRSSDRTLHPGQKAVFRFTSSAAGFATLTFEKKFRGVKGKRRKGKKGRACLPLTRRRLRALRRKAGSPGALRRLLKKRRCHGFRRVGRLRQRVRAGLNTIRFSGKLAGRRLSPGRYRARLVVRDAGGLVSRAETLHFKVLAKHRKGKSRKRQRRQ